MLDERLLICGQVDSQLSGGYAYIDIDQTLSMWKLKVSGITPAGIKAILTK